MHTLLRVLIAIILVSFGVAYTIFVISGLIPESRQLSATHLLLLVVLSIVVTLLIAPQSLSRLKLLELSGFKLELKDVKEQQLRQSEELGNIRTVLPLLLPKAEQVHLTKLLNDTATNYKGTGILRTELRRLRSIELIQMTSKSNVGDLTDGKSFNLSDYVELTELGKKWAAQVSKLAKGKSED